MLNPYPVDVAFVRYIYKRYWLQIFLIKLLTIVFIIPIIADMSGRHLPIEETIKNVGLALFLWFIITICDYVFFREK